VLRVRVFINSDQIDDVIIINRGLVEHTSMKDGEGYYLYEVFKYREELDNKGREDSFYIDHKREDGWKPLVAKAVMKLKETEDDKR